MDSHKDTSQPPPAASTSGETMEEQTLDLKVLSPSSELPPAGLQLDNLPISTTIGELRSRLTDAITSRPPPERQRLIYLGRVLQRDGDTLATLFGQVAMQQSRQHTLHLVLREGTGQTLATPATPAAPAPSSLPRPTVAYPPSAIPRPSSVPPRASGSVSPFRPTNWPPQHSPQSSSPSSARASPTPRAQAGALPVPQPQSRSQTPNQGPPVLRANAQIRATATANGQPVNLPPEVINQLLNQHFFRNGALDPFANAQRPQQPATDPAAQATTGTPPVAATPPPQNPNSNNPFQQFMASVNTAVPRPQNAAPGGEQPEAAGLEDRGRPAEQAPNPQNIRSSSQVSTNAPPNGEAAPNPAQAPGAPQGGQTITRGGITPDGMRWSTTTMTMDPNQPGAPQIPGMPPGPGLLTFGRMNIPPGAQMPPIPGMQPGMQMPMMAGMPAGQMQIPMMQAGQMPMQPGMQIPMMPGMQPGMQMPMMPGMQPGPGMQMPMAAPVAGLRPTGTPRSASPVRSVSEGPRRVGTPAMEMQHRLMHTNREIDNLNQLLSVVASGTMANGQPAHALSEEQVGQIRAYVDSMNAHIDGFGNDLHALANAHPTVRLQPEFAMLHNMFNTVQNQGRAISHRVDHFTNGHVHHGIRGGAGSPTESRRPSPSPQTSAPPTNLHDSTLTPPVPSRTPSTTSDTLSPSILTRDNSSTSAVQPPQITSATPELHLLSDPTQTQHYLLVGPHGPLGTGPLPLDVIYPLLAAQLPHDQLLRDFNRASAEMVRALQRSDLRHGINTHRANRATQQQRINAGYNQVGEMVRNAEQALGVAPGGQAQPPRAAQDAPVNGPAQQPRAAQLAQAGGPAAAPRAARNGVVGPPDEMRDILAPIIRNIWLIVRIFMFIYFFFASGRGYGRLVILGAMGGFVYAVNAGLLGAQLGGWWEGLRRHFEDLVADARGQRRGLDTLEAPVAAGTGNGEGSSRAASGRTGEPTPEETARRLMVERAEGRRNSLRDLLRQVERTIALCFASLWPGVGEAVVRNHRRRVEAEAEAQVEAQRALNEEAMKALEVAREELRVLMEAKKGEEKGEVDGVVGEAGEGGSGVEGSGVETGEGSSAVEGGDGEGVGRVNKGKGRAE